MQIEIQIKNFKSIKSTSLKLKTGLNVLIGPNGSGKSCVCSSLAFLNDLLIRGAAQAVAHAGGPKSVYHRGRKQIYFRIIHDYGKRLCFRTPTPCFFDWKIGISQTGKDNIANIFHEEFVIYAQNKGSNIKMFSIISKRPKGKKKQFKTYICEPAQFGRDFLSIWKYYYKNVNKKGVYQRFRKQLQEIAKYQKENLDKSILPQVTSLDFKIMEVVRYLRDLSEYNILPDVARAATEQLPFVIMKPNGEGVAQVIHALEQGDYHKIQSGSLEYFEDISDFYFSDFTYSVFRHRTMYFIPAYHLSKSRFSRPRKHALEKALDNIQTELSAGVKPIQSVTTSIDQTSGKRYLVFQAGNHEFRPEEVSDGTVKWLCILVSIYVPHSALYILEEPENFLHPWMQQKLVSTMRDQAREMETMFLLTSHSTTILNATEPAETLVVTTSSKGTKVQEIPNKKEIEEVLLQSEFRLGDLWVSGAISGVPSYEL